MTDWIYRVDFIGRDAAGAQSTFRYASKAYATGAAHATIPNTFVDGRVVQPLLFRRDLYGEGRTYGDIEIPHGSVVLNNSDGALDGLVAYGFDCQLLKLYRIDPANLNVDVILFWGVTEQLVVTDDSVSILVRDAIFMYDRMMQGTKFAGSNVLPAGVEGTATDLKGKPKPYCVGRVFNIEPVLVNTSRLVYQAHDKEHGNPFTPGDSSVTAVYDSRVPLLLGIATVTIANIAAGPTTLVTANSVSVSANTLGFAAAHGIATGDLVHVASSIAMPGGLVDTQYYFAGAPTTTTLTFHSSLVNALGGISPADITSTGSGVITVAKNRTPYGRYDYAAGLAPDGFYIRLGSQPIGRVTMDLTTSTNNYPTANWKDVFHHAVSQKGAGLPTNFVDLIPSASATIKAGFYWKEEINFYQAMREMMRTGNGSLHYYPESTSFAAVREVLVRLEVPGVVSRLDLDRTNIIPGSLKREPTKDTERGIPPWRVTVNYQPNYTVMNAGELAGSTQADSFALVPYLSVNVDTTSILNKFPQAPELVVDTGIANLTDATAHANYLAGLLSHPDRTLYTLQIPLSLLDGLTLTSGAFTLPGLIPGDVVKVTFPRFGLDAGKFLAVLGFTLDHQAQLADLTLWG